MTPNFDPTEAAPEVYIYNYDEDLQLQYQTSKTQTTPVQDFRLTDLSLTVEGNGAYSHATLLLEDNTGVLIDSTSRRRCTIKREWVVQIKLGKSNSKLQRWFYGHIKSATILRPGTAEQRIQLNCVGWGEILKNRITTIKRNQAKESNGIDLDTTDESTKIYNLLVDLFEDTDHYIDTSIEQSTSIGASVTEDGININATDISLANVNELGNSWAGFISRMVGVTNSDWNVDADRRLIVRDANFYDSGFLVTNKLSEDVAQNWDSGKIMYLKNEPFAWDDSSFDTMYSWIHGLGHFAPALNQSETSTPNATDNMDDEYIAIPFTPTVDNIFKIAVRLTKTGNITSDSWVEIRGDDGTGKPDLSDVRRRIRLSADFLNKLGTTTPADWAEIPVSPKLEIEPNSNLFLVFGRFGDASNTYNIDYQSGSGTYNVSTDDTTWSTATGLVNYRVYDAKRLKTSVENTVLSKKLGEQREKLLPIRADLEEQSVREAMIVAGEILGKERRIYDNVICTMPDDRIPLAAFLRFQDSLTGLDIKAEIAAYTVEMHAGDAQSNIGATTISLTLDDVHAV